ncbi:MAG: hypothetical protein OEM92_04345 [Gammaproteobacteria bacterium]|nr:hypothetical protein [Gammaproteobacteria bacterium]MDH3362431.1 hypothetical protein [Gammaproteobacteria bacterium]
MTINRSRLFQAFKYTVYVLLVMNIYWFYAEESSAAALQFANGIDFTDLIEAYSATIDTAAWVVLLLMFELETYVLDDEQFTKGVTRNLHGLRVLCYAFIVYAFYGYIANLTFHYETTMLPGVTDVCALLADRWSWAVTLDEYVELTAANCAAVSDASVFYRFRDMMAVVDAEGLTNIRYLAWVDVINAGVWLLVVMLLETDVRLQEKDRFEGLALRLSTIAKFVLYSLLLLAAIYWGLKGDFVDFWDAFLWLVAFVFIELNVFEWRQEEHQALEAEAIAEK